LRAFQLPLGTQPANPTGGAASVCAAFFMPSVSVKQAFFMVTYVPKRSDYSLGKASIGFNFYRGAGP
ncbi:MAG: hypothetical protein ACR2HF_12410, partial [Methylococcaceae bacterium]